MNSLSFPFVLLLALLLQNVAHSYSVASTNYLDAIENYVEEHLNPLKIYDKFKAVCDVAAKMYVEEENELAQYMDSSIKQIFPNHKIKLKLSRALDVVKCVSKQETREHEEQLDRDEYSRALGIMDYIESKLSLLQAIENFHTLGKVADSHECSQINYRIIKKAIASKKLDRPTNKGGRQVDIILDKYEKSISSPNCRLIYELDFKYQTLDKATVDRVEMIISKSSERSRSSWLEPNLNVQGVFIAYVLETEIIEKNLFAQNWNPAVAKRIVEAASSTVASKSSVKDDDMMIPIIEENLIKPCKYFSHQLAEFIDEAERNSLKASSYLRINSTKLGRFYSAWSRVKICRFLVQLGAKQIFEDSRAEQIA